MLQQVMTNPGEIIFREVPVPEVKENQVLVKIMNIGVCGSDKAFPSSEVFSLRRTTSRDSERTMVSARMRRQKK